MKIATFVSLLSLTLVAATRGPTVIHSELSQQKDQDSSLVSIPLKKDSGSSFPDESLFRDEPQQGPRQPSFSDLLHSHMRNVHRHFPFFWQGHPLSDDSEVGTAEEPTDGTKLFSGGNRCFGCPFGFPRFHKIFGTSFTKHQVPFDDTFIKNLPPNYKNSTSHTRTEDGSKVVINQTIHKETGDNFHHFFHHKVIHVVSETDKQNETETDEEVVPEVTDIPEHRSHWPSFAFDDAENEVDLDTFPRSDDSGVPSKNLKKMQKRSLDAVSSSKDEIIFPPDHINKFPHSMVNNKFLVPVDAKGDEKVSRTWVYKDMGGKSYLYKISHKGDPKKKSYAEEKLLATDRNAETFGTFKPVDLSRDTRVNPDGTESQQGLTLVEPEAEIFNLTLVIDEAESRANSH